MTTMHTPYPVAARRRSLLGRNESFVYSAIVLVFVAILAYLAATSIRVTTDRVSDLNNRVIQLEQYIAQLPGGEEVGQ